MARPVYKAGFLMANVYLVQKEMQRFHLQFLGLKIIDFKKKINSEVCLPIQQISNSYDYFCGVQSKFCNGFIVKV